MAGKMVFICDDSILGFAFIHLLEQKASGRSNKTTITEEEYARIKAQIKDYAKRTSSPDDIIQEQHYKKEYFTPHEIRTGTRENLFFFDPVKREYFTTKPLGYLQSAYNKRNSDSLNVYNMYNNKEILSQLTNSQTVR